MKSSYGDGMISKGGYIFPKKQLSSLARPSEREYIFIMHMKSLFK